MQSFQFDRSFDAPPPKAKAAPEPPPEPMVPEARLDEAVTQARDEGRRDGERDGYERARRELAEDLSSRLLATIETLREELPDAHGDLSQVIDEIEIRAVRSVLALIQHLAPRLSETTAKDHALRLVRDALCAARTAPELRIACADDLVDLLTADLPMAGDGPEIEIVGDPDLRPSAVRLSWLSGGLAWSPADALDRIDELLAQVETDLSRALPSAS